MTLDVARESLATTSGRRFHLSTAADGFALVETLIALFLLAYGFLAAGQILSLAAGSASLSRSKGNAITVAQSKLALLADIYRRDPGAEELSDGVHGPERVDLINPAANCVLNRFSLIWTVAPVPDPRGGAPL